MALNIKVMSDTHLEFGDLDPGTGDVLILAGDICTAVDLGSNNDLDLRFRTFFDKCVDGYNKVFYTLGNHEHYGGLWEHTEQKLRDYLEPEITILNNQSVLYEGVHFVGTTLWADFNSGSPVTMATAEKSMNDYYMISKADGSLLNPRDTLKANDESISWLSQVLPTLRGKVVVFSHHAPSFISNRGNYASSGVSGCYCSDLSRMIEQYPNIRYWFHGHLHESVNYNIGSTNIRSNPRGYEGHATNPEFMDTIVTV